MKVTLYHGDAIDALRRIEEESVQCVVTSPPYWNLRDYKVDGQLGLESTPDEYVSRLVSIFREVRRALRDDGTVWLNLGDTYASTPPGNPGAWQQNRRAGQDPKSNRSTDGESFSAHRGRHDVLLQITSRGCGGSLLGATGWTEGADRTDGKEERETEADTSTRHLRTVWTVNPKPYSGAHFAVFPPKLVEPCILAGSKKEGLILDPFVGSGTTCIVARAFGRASIGVDLNREYLDLAKARIRKSESLMHVLHPVEIVEARRRERL